MITLPTVFVIGAGASAGYGFPLGAELVRLIVQGTVQGGPMRRDLLTAGFRDDGLDAFAERLRGADPRSIDTFLEGNDAKTVEIGKAAIALLILGAEGQCLRDGRLFIGSQRLEDHWLGYVWDLMRTGATPGIFSEQNHISFLTFNYDRLIEYYLQTVVRNAFNVRPEVAKEIVGSMRIVHLHGQVAGQEFGQYQTPMPSVLLQAAARGSRVIHDPVARDDANFQTAHAFLEQAQRICLLGFGYHPVNIERLQLRSYLANASVALDGSTFRMGEAQIRVAQGQLGRAFRYVSTYQAETFLREMVPLV